MKTLELDTIIEQKKVALDKKKRIGYIDIAKGIGIILMIIGHMPLKNEYISNFIYCFHMPLFFIISGYLFTYKDNKECLKNIVRKLLVPYIITCIAIIVYKIFRLILEGNFVAIPNILQTWGLASLYGSGSMQPFGIRYIGAIWFLLALAFATYCMNNIYKSQYRYLWVILIAYIGYKTSQYIWLPFSVQAGMVAIVFMYIGILAKEKDILNKRISINIYIALIFIVAFCVKYAGKLYMVSNIYKNGFLDILGAVSASFLLIKLCMSMDKHLKYIKKPFIYIGKNSLICLCLHLFSLDCLYYNTLNTLLIKIGMSNSLLNSIILNILWVIVMLIIIKVTMKIAKKFRCSLKHYKQNKQINI